MADRRPRVIENERNRRYPDKEEAQLRGEIAHAYLVSCRSQGHQAGAPRIGIGRAGAHMAIGRAGSCRRSGISTGRVPSGRWLTSRMYSATFGRRAFWAYRSEMRAGRPDEAIRYLQSHRAASQFLRRDGPPRAGPGVRLSFDLPSYDDGFIDWLSAGREGSACSRCFDRSAERAERSFAICGAT